MVKYLGCEVAHSPPFSAEIMNSWSYSSARPSSLLLPVLQGILHLIALCVREVMRQYSASKDYKFTLLMEWLSETCDDMAFFD
jgi:hypothetical protein